MPLPEDGCVVWDDQTSKIQHAHSVDHTVQMVHFELTLSDNVSRRRVGPLGAEHHAASRHQLYMKEPVSDHSGCAGGLLQITCDLLTQHM